VRWLRFAFKILAGIAIVAVGAIAVLLVALWLDHFRETTLPAPTGKFPVGRMTLVFSDPLHTDPMAPGPGATRELFVWIWYPAAQRQPQQALDDYMPAASRKAMEGGLFITLLNRDPARVRAHSLRDARLSPGQTSYPVAIMRTGGATLATNYTTLAEDLASHGFVVVGFDAPYRSLAVVFPDGRVIARSPGNNLDLAYGPQQEQLANRLVRAWSGDTGYVLDRLDGLNKEDPAGRFTGRLDLSRVGVFGHSIGGATALQFCHDDARCKAGIDVDGLVVGDGALNGMQKPFLFLMSDHRSEPESERVPVLAKIRSVYDRLPAESRLMVTLRGANHFGFSDGTKNHIVMGAMRTVGKQMDGRRQLELSEHYIDAFFDVYLNGGPSSELKARADFPEVESLP